MGRIDKTYMPYAIGGVVAGLIIAGVKIITDEMKEKKYYNQMSKWPSKFQVMPGDLTWPTKETTKCYDCIHRLLPDPYGFQNGFCNKYPRENYASKGKPAGILFDNAECEYYEQDNES